MEKNILNSEFLKEMVEVTSNLYRLGWNERNGGNISYLISEEEVSEVLDINHVERTLTMNFDGKALAGKYFIVTGSGKYFKNVKSKPDDCLGVIRINQDGNTLDLLWGFINGDVPTSELPAHLMSHISRLSKDSNNRVVMHCHATHLIAMTFSHELTEKAFTKTLWEMCTECLVVFPDGVGIIPWIVPGTNEIGEATANKMLDTRLVIWPHHGIYGAGTSIDETFGLIETAEKSAQVYTYVCAQGGKKQTITDKELLDLANRFGVTPKAGIIG